MNASSPQGARKYFFWLILCLFPIFFFVLLELAVRLAGLGVEYPLFIPVPNQVGYLQPNPDVVKRYFSRPELAPNVSADTLYFLATKPADSVRIVVLGESTAAGFPYGRFGSPSGMLEQRLKPLYPEKQFEIINVAMAAINTYTLRDFSAEILAIKPDIALIYAGHNEYLGVMGVGSALAARDSRWKTLTYIALRHSHLFQVLDSVVAGLRMGGSPKKEVNERTLMATVAADKDIPITSPEYQQGLHQFEENMRDIIAAYHKAGVQVVIGTLASNERDQAPFSSQDRADQKLQAMLKVANDFAAAGVNDEAEKHLHIALKAYPSSADAHFTAGKIYEILKNSAEAQKYYSLAKDFDLLRFRAPEAINKIIVTLANQPGVYLADVQQLLREQSPNKIIGSAMMLEHLHPTADGYFWLTEAFFKTMQDKKILPDSVFKLSTEQALYWKPISGVDEIVAKWKIASLTSGYPFSQLPKPFSLEELQTPEQQLAASRYNNQLAWVDAIQHALNYYQKQQDWRNALVVLGQMSDGFPMSADVALSAGQLAIQINEPQLALFYSQRGLREKPNHQEILMVKAQSFFLMQRFVESKKCLQQVLSQNPQHKMANAVINQSWAQDLK